MPVSFKMHSCSLCHFTVSFLKFYSHYFRVCRSWRRIAYDKTLWRYIDITRFVSLDLRKVWKFYRSRLSDVLRSLKMVGYYNAKCKIFIHEEYCFTCFILRTIISDWQRFITLLFLVPSSVEK